MLNLFQTQTRAGMQQLRNHKDRISLRLQKLIEANHSLAWVESLDELVPRLLDLAKEVTEAEAASYLIYDAESDVLRFSAVNDTGINASTEKNLKESIELKMGQGIAGWVARERKPLVIEDVSQDERFFGRIDQSTGFVTRSILCVPVLHGPELLGVIEVLNAKGRTRFDEDDLNLLVSFADLAAVAVIRSRWMAERLSRQKVQIEIETASKIQALFRPKAPELGHDSHIWAVSQPARYVGGDLYDVISLKDGSWLIYVADVSDKGLPAALIMAALWYRIRSEASQHRNVGRLLEILNVELNDLLAEEGFFATIIIGQYWPVEGRLELACGGHPPALRISGRGAEYVDVPQGPSLGLYCCPRYGKSEIHIHPGESIVFLTDGATEASNSADEFYGRQRISEYFSRANDMPRAPGLLKEIQTWRNNTEPNDDLTLLEIWRK
jgi:serine phosphatase RsbU (regulator of sigma subunit)